MAYSDNKQIPSNINYTSKDFSTIKADLIEYTKSYFPDTYKDFNETSPGMMLIELASYVGDVLSYYIDYNYKESVLTTATERKNVLRLAEFLGYKTTPTTPSMVKLKVTTEFDADSESTPPGLPDFGDLPQNPIDSGLRIASSDDTELIFETMESVDFTHSGSADVPSVEIVSTDPTTLVANKYRATRYVNAISGETKTKSFTITSPTKFLELDLGVKNVIEILDVRDSSDGKYYEVNYLAQDRILKEISYTDSDRETAYSQAGTADDSVDVSIPYTLEYIKTNKKFVKKVDPETNNTKLQFGNGLYKFNISGSSSAALFSTIEQQGINVAGVPASMINASLNNLTTNNSLNLGETPANTILTVTYRQGGGANSNAQAGELTNVLNAPTDVSLVVTNEEAASGGTNGETITEIKENAKTFFASQMRCVTREDYQARILNLPAKFGNIAKVSVARKNNISGLQVYTLSYDQNRRLTQTPELVTDNLRNYLQQFRMINDSLDFGFSSENINISGYKINFGVDFEINHDRRFNPTDVKLEVIDCIKEYFLIDKMQFSQAINLNELRYQILGKVGVIGISKLEINQTMHGRNFKNTNSDGTDVSNGEAGYGFVYDFGSENSDQPGALKNGIIRPSATPAVFELRNPNQDIYGRVI